MNLPGLLALGTPRDGNHYNIRVQAPWSPGSGSVGLRLRRFRSTVGLVAKCCPPADLLIDHRHDLLTVSSMHRWSTCVRVGSSLQSRALIAKEGVEGSNPFFRSNTVN